MLCMIFAVVVVVAFVVVVAVVVVVVVVVVCCLLFGFVTVTKRCRWDSPLGHPKPNTNS